VKPFSSVSTTNFICRWTTIAEQLDELQSRRLWRDKFVKLYSPQFRANIQSIEIETFV